MESDNIEDVKVEEPKATEPKATEPKVTEPKAVIEKKPKKTTLDIKTVDGKKVKESDYFFGGVIPSGFKGTCGAPVEREDLVVVFNKVFKKEDNILFYKQPDKEVYIVIIPIKYSTTVGEENNSIEGDFQKHAISFLNEGSVNADTLRQKLDRVKKHVNYGDR